MFISRLSLWSRWRIVPWTGSLHWCAQASLLSSADCISARFTWLSIPSPGVNVYMWVTVKVTQSCLTLCNPMDYIGGSLVAKLRPTLVTAWTAAWQAPLFMGFPGKNTEMGCHFLLQGIFPTQELNPGILHGRKSLYQLSYEGSPRILEWVTYPFSSSACIQTVKWFNDPGRESQGKWQRDKGNFWMNIAPD